MKFIKSDGEANAEFYAALSTGLLAQHAKSGHQRISTKFNIFLVDENQKPVGGIICTCLWNGMEIDSLWVDESLRGMGWGTKLMTEAEKEGKQRGCTFAYTNTFTWQAPGFYIKLGYEIYGKLDDFPIGFNLSYYRKKLH